MTNRDRVLSALAEAGTPVHALEITRRTGIPYGTVYSLLRTLVAEELAVVSVETGPHKARPARHFYEITEDGIRQTLKETP